MDARVTGIRDGKITLPHPGASRHVSEVAGCYGCTAIRNGRSTKSAEEGATDVKSEGPSAGETNKCHRKQAMKSKLSMRNRRLNILAQRTGISIMTK